LRTNFLMLSVRKRVSTFAKLPGRSRPEDAVASNNGQTHYTYRCKIGEASLMLKKIGLLGAVIIAAPTHAQTAPGVRVPPEIGAAYGRLGKAMMAHDAAGVRTVWAKDFVVNSPNNTVIGREDVIAVMEHDFSRLS